MSINGFHGDGSPCYNRACALVHVTPDELAQLNTSAEYTDKLKTRGFHTEGDDAGHPCYSQICPRPHAERMRTGESITEELPRVPRLPEGVRLPLKLEDFERPPLVGASGKALSAAMKVNVDVSPTPEQIARMTKALADLSAAMTTLAAGFAPALSQFMTEVRRVTLAAATETSAVLAEMKEAERESER